MSTVLNSAFLLASMKEMICRFCLQTTDSNNCQPVEESLLKFLKLNSNISKENVMCIECANGLRVFSNFTLGCAYMEDETLPLSDLGNGVKLEPDAIETTTNLKSFMETEIKCSFCTKAHGREDLISIDESKEYKFMVNMLEQHISESNLKNIEKYFACETCLESLEGVSSVIMKCLEVEETISKYCELEGTDNKGQVELKEVQQFMFRSIIKSEIESFDVNELQGGSDQVQEEFNTMTEDEIKYKKEISNMELTIKAEDDDITWEQSDCNIPDIKSEESDCDGFQEPFIENESPSEMKMFKCELCSYETKLKCNLKTHLLTHKNPSDIKMFKCELCSYKVKQKCHLNRHSLVHKNPSEINMFKCEICSYEAKQKSSLKKHLLTHKNSSEVNMFKCELCPYEAKHKCSLKIHLLTHRIPSEINTFKCEMCSYEAILKGNLKQHLLTHKNSSEVNMFKCGLCPYEAKHKGSLKIHLLTHRNPSEINMFKCKMCSYEAKQKCHLKRHLLIHKNPSEINMFKCRMCSYEAKRKCHLKRHLLTHKNPKSIRDQHVT